jgi:hypothetical protein
MADKGSTGRGDFGPDWSIVFNASGNAFHTKSARDMTAARHLVEGQPVTGEYDLVLGNGGIDADHEGVSVVMDNAGGSPPLNYDWVFVDNTHRLLIVRGIAQDNVTKNISFPGADPAANIRVTIIRLPMGGEQ